MGKIKPIIIVLFLLILLLVGCAKEKPPFGASIGNGVGYYTFNGPISSTYVHRSIEYFIKRNVKKVVIEVHSPGGSLFEVWRIISLLEEHGDKLTYETRTNGIAGSGGLMIFLAGDKRLTSKHATFMWHNTEGILSTDDRNLFDIACNEYIAKQTGMTAEEVMEKISTNGDTIKKDWFFGAKEAISLGVAHGYID